MVIRAKKRSHWNDFLAQADNIWKAARYLDPQPSAFSSIPSLVTQRGGQEVEVAENKEKAAILIANFFPPVPAGWREEDATAANTNLDDPDITVDEVEAPLLRPVPLKHQESTAFRTRPGRGSGTGLATTLPLSSMLRTS